MKKAEISVKMETVKLDDIPIEVFTVEYETIRGEVPIIVNEYKREIIKKGLRPVVVGFPC